MLCQNLKALVWLEMQICVQTNILPDIGNSYTFFPAVIGYTIENMK